jgi:alanyl-tRNA synthetase
MTKRPRSGRGDRCRSGARDAPGREIELLGHGRHRPLRSVQRDLLGSRTADPGGPPGSPDEEGDRFVEIWNLVFMQYERSADGTLTAAAQAFRGHRRRPRARCGGHARRAFELRHRSVSRPDQRCGQRDRQRRDLGSPSLRVIADHIRACSFLIVDGVLPSNEGRGYVLRRIIRRAVRHGYKLGQSRPFFYQLVPALVVAMGDAFPELAREAQQVARILKLEEERFAETLSAGMVQFDTRMRDAGGSTVPGALVFLLHDTYGFPPDLTADIARERGLQVDLDGYEREMEVQRVRARAASRFGVDQRGGAQVAGRSEFRGYEELESQGRVLALLRDGESVEALAAGDHGEVILDRTPFYAEAGGQIGDAASCAVNRISILRLRTRKSAPPRMRIAVSSRAAASGSAIR